MKFSIMHISDIHRGTHTDLNNLFESLVRDSEEYVKQGIPKPSLIVVCGDVVEGSDEPNAEDVIRAQYYESTKFFEQLVEHFLGGEKERLIIVPGNHDMFRNMSKASMEKYETEETIDRRMLRRDLTLRWSWQDLSFFKIIHFNIYQKRFNLFVEFYNQFYDTIRSISGVPEEYSDVVDLPEYNVSFALFNSCYQLDHLRCVGQIYPSAVMKQARRLRDLSRRGRLIIGVWHHHIHGLPEEENYMDYRILQPMVSNHIHIGLFGHQHFSQIINQYTSIEEERQMLLISSGSLYGGRKELATGCSRQYNIIEVDMHNSVADITVNERMDAQSDYDIPDWVKSPIGKHSLQDSYKQTIELETMDVDTQLLYLDDEVNRTKDYNAAINLLYKLYRNHPRYNEMLDRYLNKANLSSDTILEFLAHPKSEVQAITLLNTVYDYATRTFAEQIVNEEYIVHNESAIIKEMCNNIKLKFKIL